LSTDSGQPPETTPTWKRFRRYVAVASGQSAIQLERAQKIELAQAVRSAVELAREHGPWFEALELALQDEIAGQPHLFLNRRLSHWLRSWADAPTADLEL
jgi:hypothetical protein